MRGALFIAIRHIRANLFQSAILIGCFALTAGLPLATSLLLDRYEQSLRQRAVDTPLVMGARGSRFDLVLTTTHFRRAPVPQVRFGVIDEINAMRLGIAIPMNTEYSARGHPLVGTSPEYRELRRLRVAAGTWPLALGEAILGASVAEKEKLDVGDTIYSDQMEAFDISRPPAIRLRVAGVLERAGTSDDDAVIVDIATSWLLSGIIHGHDNPREIRDTRMILQRNESHVAVSGAMIEYNEVTEESVAAYHLHANPKDLPLTSVIIVPRDAKSATILTTQVNLSRTEQMVVPSRVIDELLSYVLRIKSVIDAVSVVLIVVSVLLMGLIVMFSARSREREWLTMHRIGCDRLFVPKTFGIELVCLVLAGLVLAAVCAAGLVWRAPDIIAML